MRLVFIMLHTADGSMLLFTSKQSAEDFVKHDSYVKAGLVTKHVIRDYMAVTGSLLSQL
jgi:hypothetical protein